MQSSWFEYVVGLVIFGNLITIGVEACGVFPLPMLVSDSPLGPGADPVEAQMSLEMGDEFEAGSWAWVLERAYLVFYCALAELRESC